MRIYKSISSQSTKVILHFGIGLLGSAIRDCIFQQEENINEVNILFDWGNGDNNSLELIKKSCNSLIESGDEIFIIWSAGKAGFLSNQKEVETEVSAFNNIHDNLGIFLNSSFKENPKFFILLSSAGGLFEGQLSIDGSSKPNPLRPYGFGKLAMEKQIESGQHFPMYKILRISSVYSSRHSIFRLGLLATLIINGLKHKPTLIYGNMDTLRDYVYDVDISNFIVNELLHKFTNPEKLFLVSGRPYTIHVIQAMVEQIIRKKTYVTFSLNSINSSNISFNSTAIPPRFSNSDMNLNLKKLLLNLVN